MADAVFLAALNHLLAQADWARLRLLPFAGRPVRLEMPPFVFSFMIATDGRLQDNPDPATADVVIRLPADAAFLLPLGQDRMMAQATVAGNAEFATELSFVLRHLRWDIEEDLSTVIGDIAAHRIMQGAGTLADWQRRAATNLAGNVTEYLTLERPMLVPTGELETLRDCIARLNEGLDDAERRLTRL
ncbi:MAG: hypothetical protein KGZ43_01500 [Sulfuritalea sp.]|nr:hypothetical protein [Sulfuritalea sp.]